MKALPDGLAISVLDRGLISGKFLILKGNAGVGKSQALAYHAADRIDKESCSLLLLGSEMNQEQFNRYLRKTLSVTAEEEQKIEQLFSSIAVD